MSAFALAQIKGQHVTTFSETISLYYVSEIDKSKPPIMDKSSPIDRSAIALQALSSFTQSGYINVPHNLLSDAEDINAEYDAVSKPQWNHVVDMIEERRYTEVLAMLERLGARMNKTEESREAAQEEVNQYQMLLYLLKHDAKIYGLGKTIKASLGDSAPQSNRPDWWQWHVVRLASLDENGEETTVKYSFQPVPTINFKSSFAASKFPEYPTPLNGGDTWKEAIEEVRKSALTRLEHLDRIRGVLSVLRFRVSIIEGVLWEYENLGKVFYYDERKRHRQEKNTPIPEYIIQFIKRGLALYEAKPDDFANREALIKATLQALVDEDKEETKWAKEYDSRKIRIELGVEGLYNKKNKRGKPKEVDQLPYLKEMVGLWKKFLSKGRKELKGK